MRARIPSLARLARLARLTPLTPLARFPGLVAFGLCLGSLGLLGLLGGCSEPQGRVMEDSEQDYVGARAAGAEAYNRLIAGAVEKLLQDHISARAGTGRLSVAALPVENASAEELGDWQEEIYELIATSINQSGRYRTINRRFIEEALRTTRLRQEQLFIPAQRRQFLQTLETTNNPAQLLLFPKLTSGTTLGEDVKQRSYTLTLDLVDVETGEDYKVAERIRKAYTK